MRVLTDAEALSVLGNLAQKLAVQRPALQQADQYFTGTQPLSFLAPEIQAQVGQRVRPLTINWARKSIEGVTQRLSVEGFGLGNGAADAGLWQIWQDCDLDEWSQMCYVDALVHGRSFMSVWAQEDNLSEPQILVESAYQVAVDYDPSTHRVRAALKMWNDNGRQFATLMLPDRIHKYSSDQQADTGLLSPLVAFPNLPVEQQVGYLSGWTIDDKLDNPLGVVPMVPFVNKPRLMSRDGESEINDIRGLVDAIGKLCTDMLVTSEYYAQPRRWATGLEIQTTTQERLREEVRKYWDAATKDKTWLAGSGVQFGQFQEASLTNFVAAVNLLTSMVAAIAGLPPDDLGLTTTNPASAEARRAADNTLVLRTKQTQKWFSGSQERVLRLAVAVQNGVPVAALPRTHSQMETFWTDPEIQTTAQTADAAVKLHAEGIIDTVQAQEDIGLSPVQRQAIADRASEASTASVAAQLAAVDAIVDQFGISRAAALSAVGLQDAALYESKVEAHQPPTPSQVSPPA